jgi:lipocalin-like protein
MKRNLAIVATVMLVCTAIAWVKAAEISSPIVGTWRITGFSYLTPETNEISRPFGENPIGYLQYSPGGHVVVFLSAGNPPKPASVPYTDAERASIHTGIIAAYAGTYSAEGNKVTQHIVASSRPEWIGGDQIRYVELNGNKLTIKTAPLLAVLTGKRSVATLTFERVE